MLITILILSLIVIWSAFRLRAQVNQQGVVLDFWNRFSSTVMSLGTIVLVTIFSLTTPEQWTEMFGTLGETVKAIDAAIVGVTMLYTIVKGWLNKTP